MIVVWTLIQEYTTYLRDTNEINLEIRCITIKKSKCEIHICAKTDNSWSLVNNTQSPCKETCQKLHAILRVALLAPFDHSKLIANSVIIYMISQFIRIDFRDEKF